MKKLHWLNMSIVQLLLLSHESTLFEYRKKGVKVSLDQHMDRLNSFPLQFGDSSWRAKIKAKHK